MIRILITLLAITLATPSSSAASMMENRDLDWIGPTCCASESETESEQSEFQSACCCSLSPIYHAGEASDARLLTNEHIVASPHFLVMIVAHLQTNELTRTLRLASARGPPRETLLSQHTLLQL